jgi:replicative DNA helicase
MATKEYSVEHENALLGAMLIDNTVHDFCEVCVDWFKQSKQRQVAQAIHEIIDAGGCADLMSVYDRVKPDIEPMFISKLTSNVPSAANAQYYADILRENHEFSLVEKLPARLADWLKCGDASGVLFEIDKYLNTVFNQDQKVRKFSSVVSEAMEQIEASYKSKKELDGLSSGWRSLDDMLCGIPDGDLLIIGARPSIGKSAFAMNMATAIAEQNIPVGFFSLEMRGVNLAKRSIAGKMKKNYKDIRIGRLVNSDFPKLLTACGQLEYMPLYLDDTSGIGIGKLCQRIRQMKRKGVKIIFIDYLTLIMHPDQKQTFYVQVTDICRMLKNLARKINIPIVVLSQLKRTTENKPPILSDLAQSGNIEADADTIIFLHRENRDKGETQVHVAKQRNGETGIIKMMFLLQELRFEEMYQGRDNE